MKEKIAEQKKAVEELRKKLRQEENKLSEMFVELQKSCSHDKKEKIFVFVSHLKTRILKGYKCEDCGLFIPSKVYDEPLHRIRDYCMLCDGVVVFEGRSGSSYNSDREDRYKCKVCGNIQEVFVG